jgi:hypothetical protein
MQFLKFLINEPIERNCVFGAIVGVESLYLLMLVNRRRIAILWSLLLPLLAAYALVDTALSVGLIGTPLITAYPYFMALVAAAGATLLLYLNEMFSGKAKLGTAEELLLFASFTALLMTVSQWSAENVNSVQKFTSAIYIWIGYGLGALAFWCIGRKLCINAKSPSKGIGLLYILLAIVSAVLAGFSGLKL